MRRRLADRRARPRYEIVGQMHGSIETTVSLAICNISAEGVLVRSALALAIGPDFPVTLRWDLDEVPARVRVRHVRLDTTTVPAAYMIGLEFVAPSPQLQQQITACMVSGGPAGEPA